MYGGNHTCAPALALPELMACAIAVAEAVDVDGDDVGIGEATTGGGGEDAAGVTPDGPRPDGTPAGRPADSGASGQGVN